MEFCQSGNVGTLVVYPNHGWVYSHAAYITPWIELAAATRGDSMLSSDWGLKALAPT